MTKRQTMTYKTRQKTKDWAKRIPPKKKVDELWCSGRV